LNNCVLVAVPPKVVTSIAPEAAPAGTVALTNWVLIGKGPQNFT
jgi:hypothetical protein